MAYKARFILLAAIFIYIFFNFYKLQTQRLEIVLSIIYKLELESTSNLLYKNKNVYLYIAL